MKRKVNFLLFPILLIIIYEIFAIRIFKIIQFYSFGYYAYFIIASATISLIASILSDKYSRKSFLNFCLFICIFLIVLLFLGYNTSAIIFSPLFFSTPIARAALIDNHKHISIKNLMSIAYISVFLPWSFYSFFSLSISDIFVFVFLILTCLSAIFFKLKKKLQKEELSGKILLINKSGWLYFALAFTLTQLSFFLIFGKLEHVDKHTYVFDFMNIGLLIGAVFCIFLTGQHNELIFLSYVFIFILTFNAFLGSLFWNLGNLLKILLGELSIAGGVILPLITEKTVMILGSQRRGVACGLVEFISSVASIVALIGVFLFLNGYRWLILTLLVLICSSCVLQGISNFLAKKSKMSN